MQMLSRVSGVSQSSPGFVQLFPKSRLHSGQKYPMPVLSATVRPFHAVATDEVSFGSHGNDLTQWETTLTHRVHDVALAQRAKQDHYFRTRMGLACTTEEGKRLDKELKEALGKIRDAFDQFDTQFAQRKGELSPKVAEWMELFEPHVRKARAYEGVDTSELRAAQLDAYKAWQTTKKSQTSHQFKTLAPHLERIVSLSQERAKKLQQPHQGSLYEVLLEESNPGLSQQVMDELVNDLKPKLIQLVKDIQTTPAYQNKPVAVLNPVVDADKQTALTKDIAKDLGFDFSRGGVYTADRALCIPVAFSKDVRVIRRLAPTNLFTTLRSTVHELGHGLFNQGVKPEWAYLPLVYSGGLHESQARMFETLVGQSPEFAQYLVTLMKNKYQDMLPPDVDTKQFAADLYRQQNQVAPNLMRINSDEVTYNLHIIMRYEMERDLINGKLAVNDVPDVWRQKMKGYLGIEPGTNDYEGPLQDPHWYNITPIGTFPSYLLGNLMAAQFFDKAKQDVPHLTEGFAKSEFKPLLNWLNHSIHDDRLPRPFLETVQLVTGQPLSSEPLMNYLNNKYKPLYGLAA